MFRRFVQKSAENNANTEEQYCLVRWSDNYGFDIVSQKQVISSTASITVYETYTIDFNREQRKGTVILQGTKQDCEKLKSSIAPSKSEQTTKSTNPPARVASANASNILADVQEDSKNDGDNGQDEKAIRAAVLMKLLQLVLADDSDDDNPEVHRVPCAACGSSRIRSDRYKCLNCKNVNLCARCFERRKESNTHKSGHAFVHFKSPGELFGQSISDDEATLDKLKTVYDNDVHQSVTCDGCKCESIKGLRFKCDTCPNYDLCQQCFQKGAFTETHKPTHPLILVPCRAIQQIPYDDIELGDKLGNGAFGAVFKSKWISKNRPVACKVIMVPKTGNAERLEKSFLKEIAAYAELSGAYILKTYGITLARHEQGKLYMLVMEYMSRGSLANLIEKNGDKISLRRKLDMAMNIASGMRKIHEHKMIHRDIRPDNILVNENYVAKIGDMGIARVIDPFNQHTQIGFLPYMPPEFYLGNYDQKLDIFTFGLTLNELFTSTKHIFQDRGTHKIAFTKESPVVADLIARCTADDPKNRPTAVEIEKTLELYSTGFNEIVLKKYPTYITLSTEDKNEIFIAFYQKFHQTATEFIRKQFPLAFPDDLKDLPGVKVDKDAAERVQVECPIQ